MQSYLFSSDWVGKIVDRVSRETHSNSPKPFYLIAYLTTMTWHLMWSLLIFIVVCYMHNDEVFHFFIVIALDTASPLSHFTFSLIQQKKKWCLNSIYFNQKFYFCVILLHFHLIGDFFECLKNKLNAMWLSFDSFIFISFSFLRFIFGFSIKINKNFTDFRYVRNNFLRLCKKQTNT